MRLVLQSKLGIGLAGLLLALPRAGAAAGEKIDFNFQVRPILSDRCFSCHGPDEKSRMAKLRLDQPESALGATRDGRLVIKPGDPARSELVRRIASADPAVRMPPPWSKLSLEKAEIDLLRRWVEQGAEYRRHWAFIPAGSVPIPEVRVAAWVRNPIDRFVLARLEREDLPPSPEATRETLIRRASLDLVGLPPAVEEIDAFLADRSPDAYEKLVDRLLASPRYGERQAADWLDPARFADTYGYQNDVERDVSAWRDWLIRAFNENLSYDRFVTWQIAGDLLPAATGDQKLATAVNRLHRQTNEGGSVEEEFRVEYVADRVATMGTAFLGLTLECARCHDHKYDPIRQRDYYRLFAFFDNIDESGLYSHFTRATPSPSLLLYGEGQEARHRALRRKIAAAEARLRGISAKARDAAPAAPPRAAAAFAFDEIAGDRTPDAAGGRPAELVDGPQPVQGRSGRALRFTGDNSVVCRGAGAFRRIDPFSFSLWLRPAERQPRAVVLHRSRSWTDAGSRGYELVLENGRPTFSLIHFWPGNALSVRAREELPLGAWSHLAITYDGSSRAAGVRLYLDGRRVETRVVRDNLFKDIVHREAWGDMEVDRVDLALGARFRDAGFKGGAIDELRIFDAALGAAEVRALAVQQENASPGESTLDRRLDPEHRAAAAELAALRAAENELVNDVPEISVMREMPGRRPTRVLERGAYHAPGERVAPGTPDAILPFSADLPANRLGLARWLTDRRNPLTARVAVNRVWRIHFGRGIVPTLENFGSQGELPTHPDLLDWLAGWFVDHGWDRKALHRLIVTSAAYRQASSGDRELLQRDPENRLLARGPRHRLDAEQIRDGALAASGLLSPALGGQSVRPYQPAGLWEESGTHKTYVQDHGEKLYRRSLYTFWRRTMPPPSMTAFDAPSREVCTARREATATPLQALVLLNDPQFVEAARVLAERLVSGPVQARIDGACRRLLGRRPSEQEREVLGRLYAEQLAYFTAHPDAAERYLATGEHPRVAGLPAAEVAATAVVANTLMNHDEFVVKR